MLPANPSHSRKPEHLEIYGITLTDHDLELFESFVETTYWQLCTAPLCETNSMKFKYQTQDNNDCYEHCTNLIHKHT